MEGESEEISDEVSVKKRGPRTSQDQREVFVSFAEQNPQLVDNLHSRYQKLWDEVTSLLNEAPGPKRFPEDWQINFRNWHYNLSSKRRCLFNDVNETGGGPSKGKMTRFEERAMRVWTKTPVTGNPVPVSGLGECNDNMGDPLSGVEESSSSGTLPRDSSGVRGQKRPKNLQARDDDVSKILRLMERKQEVDEENAKNLQNFVANIGTLANAMHRLAENLDKKINMNKRVSNISPLGIIER